VNDSFWIRAIARTGFVFGPEQPNQEQSKYQERDGNSVWSEAVSEKIFCGIKSSKPKDKNNPLVSIHFSLHWFAAVVFIL
jgi:hypothetical protein